MPNDMDEFSAGVLADMRAHDGTVTTGPLAGHPILVMTSTGAKSGQPRASLLTYHRDGEDYIVAGSAGGSTKDPAWLHNLDADPSVQVEVDTETVPGTATVVRDGAERDRLWTDHVAALPWFADYPRQTGRRIPMVRLTLQPA